MDVSCSELSGGIESNKMNDTGKRCRLGLSSVKETALRLAAGDGDPLVLASEIIR
jgi:hypothetical protein